MTSHISFTDSPYKSWLVYRGVHIVYRALTFANACYFAQLISRTAKPNVHTP